MDMNRQTIPIHPRVATTLGGITTDEHGRAVSGKWSRWFTGLYAAGDAACSGLHGAGLIAGNRLLDALAGGAVAGEHAAEYAASASFTGRGSLETALGAGEADLDLTLVSAEGAVQRLGPIRNRLLEIMNAKVCFARDATGLESAIEELQNLSADAENLHIDDTSRLYNSNLLAARRLQGAIRMGIATAQSALTRTESRGTHRRTDFTDSDDEQIHHTLVDNNGTVSTLAIRKSASGSWVLTPEA
jgi:succinate dehydrogenase/fumarate reductase flavoprotein subunit